MLPSDCEGGKYRRARNNSTVYPIEFSAGGQITTRGGSSDGLAKALDSFCTGGVGVVLLSHDGVHDGGEALAYIATTRGAI